MLKIHRFYGVIVMVLACATVITAQEREGRELSLIEAAKRADKSGVSDLLKEGVDANASEADGTTALHWAVQRENLEAATLMMSAGADANAANRYGVTPLALACVNGNAAIVRALLEAGGRCQHSVPRGRDRAHDRGENRKNRRRRTAARPWRAGECEGALERDDSTHVGSSRGTHRHRSSAPRGRCRVRCPISCGIHSAPLCRSGGAHGDSGLSVGRRSRHQRHVA